MKFALALILATFPAFAAEDFSPLRELALQNGDKLTVRYFHMNGWEDIYNDTLEVDGLTLSQAVAKLQDLKFGEGRFACDSETARGYRVCKLRFSRGFETVRGYTFMIAFYNGKPILGNVIAYSIMD